MRVGFTEEGVRLPPGGGPDAYPSLRGGSGNQKKILQHCWGKMKILVYFWSYFQKVSCENAFLWASLRPKIPPPPEGGGWFGHTHFTPCPTGCRGGGHKDFGLPPYFLQHYFVFERFFSTWKFAQFTHFGPHFSLRPKIHIKIIAQRKLSWRINFF